MHGSSVAVYDSIITDKIDESENGVYIGNARPIRGDEFNVQLPYYFSQKYNNFEKNSNQMSITGQNMILGYNAPVKDVTLIGKPFVWGYMLLGNEYGLSWYWCLKIILFLLVSYELCMMLTKKKSISIVGAFIIVFSPSMQWWFSPHMYDVFFWASALLVIGYHYFTAKNKNMKILLTVLAPCAVIGFILGLFPSCQIPLGLIAISLLISLLIRDKDKITFTKKDSLRIVIDILVVVAVMGYFLFTSKDELSLLYGTVYPGKRISLGGMYQLSDLFTDVTNLFTPFKSSLVANDCEVSTFNHLGVLFMLYFPYLYTKMRKEKDSNQLIGLVLFIILAIEIVFMLFTFPEWLAKITLFSYINRMKIVFGFTATLFTIWNFYMVLSNKEYVHKLFAALCLLLFGALYIYAMPSSTFEYFESFTSGKLTYVVILAFMLLGASIFARKKEIVMTGLIGLSVVSSCTVNPIAIGVPSLYNHEIIKIAEKLIDEKNGNWLCLNNIYDQNLFLANGAKVLNAVNFYPDFDKWDLVDANRKNEFFYNRYAHMVVELTNDSTINFELIAPDAIKVFMPVKDLKKWNIDYITSRIDYSDLMKEENLKFELVYFDEKDNIYLYSIADAQGGD